MVYGLPQAFGLRNDEGGEWGFMDCFASLAMTVYTNSSLRELLATRGNLSMGYNYSFMEFFFFSVFVFAISGLWGLASLCKGGADEVSGGLREKLKIKN